MLDLVRECERLCENGYEGRLMLVCSGLKVLSYFCRGGWGEVGDVLLWKEQRSFSLD